MHHVGKAQRLRAERKAAAEQVLEQIRRRLQDVTLTVMNLFGDTPDCAGAAALMVAVGDELRIPLRARPVSVVVQNTDNGDMFFMGPTARASLSAEQLARTEDLTPGGKDTGHMVVTSDEANLLLDPNLTQARAYGMDAPAVVMRVNSTDPGSGEWFFRHAPFVVQYMLDEENRLLMPRFDRHRVEAREMARHIADRLRKRAPPTEIARGIMGANRPGNF